MEMRSNIGGTLATKPTLGQLLMPYRIFGIVIIRIMRYRLVLPVIPGISRGLLFREFRALTVCRVHHSCEQIRIFFGTFRMLPLASLVYRVHLRSGTESSVER